MTSVFLALFAGHDVLFQDADVIWLRDPLAYFAEEADPAVDTFWMDDGARTSRYAPYFANSGFYYLRANDRTKNLMYRMLQSFDSIITFRSHQHVLDQHLIEHSSRFGLSVVTLDKQQFPQGQVFHRSKSTMQAFVDGRLRPYVFHMCWTANEKDKLKYLQNLGLWFLRPNCSEADFRGMFKLDKSGEPVGDGLRRRLTCDACCAPTRPWVPNPDYVTRIDLRS